MKSTLARVPDQLLEHRRRLGLDKLDEMWEGVIHMVPPAGGEHGRLDGKLFLVLAPLAEAQGLVAFPDGTGIYNPHRDKSWRVPDMIFVSPEFVSERGVEGRAEFVIEIRSPDDETYEKFPFYAEVGVKELLVVHPPTRAVEFYRLEDGKLVQAQPEGEGGEVRSKTLGVTFAPVSGPGLRISWENGSAEV